LDIYQPTEYKRVKDYPNYEICNLGFVISYTRGDKAKIMKPAIDHDGYKRVWLTNDKGSKYFRVHRIVAEHFKPNPKKKKIVNHLDEVKLNNEAINLEWATIKENTNYGTGLERSIKKREKPVAQLTKEGTPVRVWKSATQASKENGFNQGHISACCRGKEQQHKGYRWIYLPPLGASI
jgi:hypothetical protein